MDFKKDKFNQEQVLQVMDQQKIFLLGSKFLIRRGPISLESSSFPLSQLIDLYLQENSLFGPLPSLSDLSNLQTTYFGCNNFTSILSAAFSSLTSLQKLSLFNNLSLSPWPFPTDLTQSSTLSDLDFGSAGITGDPQLRCDSLFDLQLRDNKLTGVVPSSLMALPSLKNSPVPVFDKGVQVTLDEINNTPGPCDEKVMVLLKVAEGFGYPSQFAESWKGNDPCT
ncbi:hypothetical protein Ahy_A09g046685 [Arachis hypogaea]|uniref:Uncharacterized protein n=1 Tax=Arachis hypogaea TaxID=3818 RepID=A0A445BQL3_ARAHY|nr:hypothetical protein Ahy_A09g046685 [Arachis hypogaea]